MKDSIDAEEVHRYQIGLKHLATDNIWVVKIKPSKIRMKKIKLEIQIV